MLRQDMLGSPREDLFGIVHDFVTKLHNGKVLAPEAKRFLRGEDPWPSHIVRALPFDPIKVLGKGWSIHWQERESLSREEVDLKKVKLETSVQVYHIRLDARFFMPLIQRKKPIPPSWRGKYVSFSGTVLSFGNRKSYVLALYCGNPLHWKYREEGDEDLFKALLSRGS